MTTPTAEPPPSDQQTRRSRGSNGTGGGPGEPMTAPEPPKLRRRPMLIAASILLTALGALLGAWLLTALSGTESYVAVRDDIQRGDVIKETDLVRTQLRADAAVAPLRWDQQQVIVGRYATVDMAKGSLVTQSSVATEIRPAGNQTLVGLSLVPGQTVSGDLKVGQTVRIVIVPATADSGVTTTNPTAHRGEVAGVRLSDDGSTKLVDVQVSSAVAPSIASSAARQEVSLIVDPESGGPSDGAPEPSGSPSSPTSSPSN